jgi:hypothetical protein
VCRVIASAPTQDYLDAAKDAILQSRSEDEMFTEQAPSLLTEAIKNYNMASQKSNLDAASRNTLNLQLGKVHGQRAIAEYSQAPCNLELATYHLRLAADHLQSYREKVGTQEAAPKLSSMATKMLEICDKNVDAPRHRRSLAATFAADLIGGEISGYDGSRLPRVQLHMYLVQQCWLQSVRILHGETSSITAVFAELERLCRYPASEPEEDEDGLISAWTRVQQEMTNAATYLAQAKFHLLRAEAESPELSGRIRESLDSLSVQVEFMLQRACCVRKLSLAADKQRKVFIESEALDMQDAYDAVDAWRGAYGVAESLEKSGVAVDGLQDVQHNPDVELMGVALSFLGSLWATMRFEDKAKDSHIKVLRLGLSLDPNSSSSDEPSPALTSKPWWMKSKTYLQQKQRDVVEAEERERAAALGEIEEEVQALTAARNNCSKPGEANDDPRPFLKHIFEKHPPKTAVAPNIKTEVDGDEVIKKTTFMKVMRYYHPDKLGSDPPRREELLYQEIQKFLNSIYEKNYKS